MARCGAGAVGDNADGHRARPVIATEPAIDVGKGDEVAEAQAIRRFSGVGLRDLEVADPGVLAKTRPGRARRHYDPHIDLDAPAGEPQGQRFEDLRRAVQRQDIRPALQDETTAKRLYEDDVARDQSAKPFLLSLDRDQAGRKEPWRQTATFPGHHAEVRARRVAYPVPNAGEQVERSRLSGCSASVLDAGADHQVIGDPGVNPTADMNARIDTARSGPQDNSTLAVVAHRLRMQARRCDKATRDRAHETGAVVGGPIRHGPHRSTRGMR